MNPLKTIISAKASPVFEYYIAFFVALLLASSIVFSSDFSETKYRVVFLVGLLGIVALWLIPDRRALAVALWIPLHTLGLESIFEFSDAIYPGFEPQKIPVTGSDCILAVLLLYETVDALLGKRESFRITQSAKAFFLFMMWSVFSYAMHAIYIEDGFVNSSPLNLVHLLRTFGFIVILGSAIRTRADMLLILLSLLVSIGFQSVLVIISYATEQVMNLTTLTGGYPNVKIMIFADESGGQNIRATGSVGHTNEQAAFHALTTLPLVALLVLRSGWVRFLAIVVVLMSGLALVLTFSRGGWIAFFIGFCVSLGIAIWRHEIKRGGWLLISIITLVGTLAIGVLSEPIYQRLTNGDEGATESRMRMIMLALDLASEYPIIGVGPGEFAESTVKLYPPDNIEMRQILAGKRPEAPTIGRLDIARYVLKTGLKSFTIPLPVHNKYLLTLSETGIIGLLLFLNVMWQFLRASWRCAKMPDAFIRIIGITGFSSVIAALAYMNLDLFADDKSVTTLFLVPVLVEAACYINSGTRKINPTTA